MNQIKLKGQWAGKKRTLPQHPCPLVNHKWRQGVKNVMMYAQNYNSSQTLNPTRPYLESKIIIPRQHQTPPPNTAITLLLKSKSMFSSPSAEHVSIIHKDKIMQLLLVEGSRTLGVMCNFSRNWVCTYQRKNKSPMLQTPMIKNLTSCGKGGTAA